MTSRVHVWPITWSGTCARLGVRCYSPTTSWRNSGARAIQSRRPSHRTAPSCRKRLARRRGPDSPLSNATIGSVRPCFRLSRPWSIAARRIAPQVRSVRSISVGAGKRHAKCAAGPGCGFADLIGPPLPGLPSRESACYRVSGASPGTAWTGVTTRSGVHCRTRIPSMRATLSAVSASFPARGRRRKARGTRTGRRWQRAAGCRSSWFRTRRP